MCTGYSTVRDWISKLNREEDTTQRASGSERLFDNRIDVLIADALEYARFHPVRSLCSAIKYPRTSVWRHLHSADYDICDLHLVPHTLSPAQKVQTVRTVIELKKVLGSAKQRN